MIRDLADRATCRIELEDGLYRHLPHLCRHSPDGFEWGYSGSGPADLARSIVGDVLQHPDPSPRQYQRIKAALITTLPHEGGTITEDEVLQVLRDYLDEVSR